MDKKQNNTLLILLVGLVALLSLISVFVVASNRVDEEALADKVTTQVVSQLPDEVDIDELATEVAGKINVSVPEIEVPKFESDEKVKDLWEAIYADEIEELETEAYDIAVEELEDDNYELIEEYLESAIEGFDELKEGSVEDYEINIIKLGIDDEEDKIAEVVFELEVEYTLKEGPSQDYKKELLVKATVLFEDGNFDDEEVDWEIPITA